MRSICMGILLLGLTAAAFADDAPVVEKYLHSGELARGEQVLETSLQAAPQDHQLRLSLGFLQIVRAVERLGQSMYEYGLVEDGGTFMRLPLPKNPDPSPVTYADFRRVVEQFHSDLATAEATLAKVADDHVTLRLRLADIRLDLDGNQQAEETLGGIVTKLLGPRFRLPGDNTDFEICIDRGDVAWLRAYCHVLMAIVDFQAAFDGEQAFDLTTSKYFAKAKVKYKLKDPDDRQELDDLWKKIVVKDPVRLGHFRQHMIAVCDLNHETWRYIRAERDDDHEWLPNSNQKGILGLPVTDEMINAWLGMIDEFKGLMSGTKVIPAALIAFLSPAGAKSGGFSFKEFLDNPPDVIDWNKIQTKGFDAHYLVDKAADADVSAFLRVSQVLDNSLSVGYAVWFN